MKTKNTDCFEESSEPQYISTFKPRLHERFFARAGDAIFSNFVTSPAQEGGYASDKF